MFCRTNTFSLVTFFCLSIIFICFSSCELVNQLLGKKSSTSSKPAPLAALPIIINELMADSQELIQDKDGDFPDWIEILNNSNQEIPLEGWTLTDDNDQIKKWTFPKVTIQPNQMLLLFASGKNISNPSELHTNFKLDRKKGHLSLWNPLGQKVHSIEDYPSQKSNVSYGLLPSDVKSAVIDRFGFFKAPTPGKSNSESHTLYVADTKFSINSGVFQDSINLTITTDTDDATIYVTTDGSIPSATNGMIYKEPILLDRTTVIRAVAEKYGSESTNVDTQFYLFPESVWQQSGDGLPNDWGLNGPDYAIDQTMIPTTDDQKRFVDSLSALPTFSLVADPNQLFSSDKQGIYVSPNNRDIEASIELLEHGSRKGFKSRAGLSTQGYADGEKFKTDKLSFRLKFKTKFGNEDLEGKIFGPDSSNIYDNLVLDASLDDSFLHEFFDRRKEALYIRDQLISNLLVHVGNEAPRGFFVQLYINGLYWGIYNLHERPDDAFAASYFGGKRSQYDIIKHGASEVIQGSSESYLQLYDLATGDLSQESVYQQIAKLLAIDEFIRYLIVNFYVGNIDWPCKNFYASRHQSPEGKWRFHSWDAEQTLLNVDDNVTLTSSDMPCPTYLHQRLIQNATYRKRFQEFVNQLMVTQGAALTASSLSANFQQQCLEVEASIFAEAARWGDNRDGVPLTVNDWIAERDRLINTYLPSRTAAVLSQFQANGWWTP